jgi:predicted nucleotidyltransferase
MENKTINIQTIAEVAKGLQELRQKIIFVGGAVISLYTDDEAAEEIRPTADIDLTIQVTGYAGWVHMQKRLGQLGFLPDPQGHSICSYLYHGISVDVMPSEDGPFGPSNRWYKPGFDYLNEVVVNDEITVQILSAPYFLATKLEAFKSRGGDYRTSHDFEDIVYVIDNRIHIVEEVRSADGMVKSFIQNELSKIVFNPYLEEIIRAQIHPLIVDDRYPIVLDKIKRITI